MTLDLGTDEGAAELLSSVLVWDNHACMPLRPGDEDFLPQLERYRSVGVDVVSLNVGFGEQGIEEHIRMLAHLRRWLRQRPEAYRIVTAADDIDRARAAGQLAVCFDIEGSCAVGGQASMIGTYYDLGVRWLLLAYNRANAAGSGCQDEEDGGLTDFGRELIDEMNRVGMIACCSHTGHRTARDVIDYSPAPIIFSHSNAQAVWNHPRNIPDSLIRACADKGGVVGVNGVGIFLGPDEDAARAVARHIDHMIKVAGEDHVALGLDYVFDIRELDDYVVEMGATFPASHGYGEGMALFPPEQIPNVVKQLAAFGYRDRVIEKVLGSNLMRLARDLWK